MPSASYYKTGATIRDEWQAQHPGQAYPSYGPGGMITNLFLKPPGWRAAEGYGKPALGYPQKARKPANQPFLALAAATSLASSSPLL